MTDTTQSADTKPDLSERLREGCILRGHEDRSYETVDEVATDALMLEAADEIDRLRKEVEGLEGQIGAWQVIASKDSFRATAAEAERDRLLSDRVALIVERDAALPREREMREACIERHPAEGGDPEWWECRCCGEDWETKRDDWEAHEKDCQVRASLVLTASAPAQPGLSADFNAALDRATELARPDVIQASAPAFVFGYTNYRGEFGIRKAIPIRPLFGSTEWHPEPQWLLEAHDVEKGAIRLFAMKDMAPAQQGAGEVGGLRAAAYRVVLETNQDTDGRFVVTVTTPNRSRVDSVWSASRQSCPSASAP